MSERNDVQVETAAGFSRARNRGLGPRYSATQGMRRILATDFGIWPTATNIHLASDQMVTRSEHRGRLANYLLLYDQIVIPTGNIQIISVLRIILGDQIFDEMIRHKVIVLARFDQWLGYAGNGSGMVYFQVGDDPTRLPSPNLATAHFKPLGEAIDTAITLTNPPSPAIRRQALSRLLQDNIVELNRESLFEGLREESYSDITKSPYLRDFLSLRNRGRTIDQLIGVNPNQLILAAPQFPPQPDSVPEVEAVLRVGFENLLLSMAGATESSEITADRTTMSVLAAKGQRLGYAAEGERAFTKLQDFSGVPDLGTAFANGLLSPQQILDLRNSKHAQAMRDWFEAGSPHEEASDTIRRFVEAVGKPSWIDSIPSKSIRLALTTAVGALDPIVGAGASALDSFLLPKWFPRQSPRLFMKQAKVMLANTAALGAPTMKGRDRNTRCSCGSGRKLKHCCGR